MTGPIRALLQRAFPPSLDFAGLLRALALVVVSSMEQAHAQLLSESPDLKASDAAYAQVRPAADALLDALNRSFSTPFDREDILRAEEELVWVAEYADHAVRERVVLGIAPDHTIEALADALLRDARALARAYALLPSQEALAMAQEVQGREYEMRSLYEAGLAALLVPGADPIEVMKRREIYHHLTDGGKRLRKAARVLSIIIVKDPS